MNVAHPKLITACKNGQVPLPCSVHHNSTTVAWKYISRSGFNESVVYSDEGFVGEYLEDSRRNKVNVIMENVGQFDIRINDARIDDSGTYRCEDSNQGLREIYNVEGE